MEMELLEIFEKRFKEEIEEIDENDGVLSIWVNEDWYVDELLHDYEIDHSVEYNYSDGEIIIKVKEDDLEKIIKNVKKYWGY